MTPAAIDFYLDFASPYACLAFDALPQALQGCAWRVRYIPVALGGLFKAHGQTSPAAIPAKHDWIRRHTLWLARQGQQAGAQDGLPPFAWPEVHPFNSLGLARLALACSLDGSINRYTAETIFHHVWRTGGAPALDAQRLAALEEALQAQLRPAFPLGSEANKNRLRENTEQAQHAGVFGVPSYVIDAQMLWGLDALPMLRELAERAPQAPAPV